MEESIQICISADISHFTVSCGITVRRDVWCQDVRYTAMELEGTPLHEMDVSGYGDPIVCKAYHSNKAQAAIAFLLLENGIGVGEWLHRIGALEQLRAKMLSELAKFPKSADAYKMLKESNDLTSAMLGFDENGNDREGDQIVFIHNEFPPKLLDDVYKELKKGKR